VEDPAAATTAAHSPKKAVAEEPAVPLAGIEYWSSLPQDITIPTESPLKPPQSSDIATQEPENAVSASEEHSQPVMSGIDESIHPDAPPGNKEIEDETTDPPLRALAARSLITLSSFDNLSYSQSVYQSQGTKANTSQFSRDALLRTLFSIPPAEPLSELSPSEANSALANPVAYDPLYTGTRHSTRYVSKRMVFCAVTGNVARYRDPFTGLPYATSAAYKSLRRLIKGASPDGRSGAVWSSVLEAWIGEPRAANMVPRDVWEGTYVPLPPIVKTEEPAIGESSAVGDSAAGKSAPALGVAATASSPASLPTTMPTTTTITTTVPQPTPKSK
jgi:hypothetical protein